jgi:glycine dehydrogenase
MGDDSQNNYIGAGGDFARRHIGPTEDDVRSMLETIGCATLDELIDSTIPADIRLSGPMSLPPARSERELLVELAAIAGKNRLLRSWIGMGYHDCITPPVIQRNILENPGWYTQYTPYQAEIAQGRLEALLNFQTMVADLTGLALANASLLDEATAAAEAMTMCRRIAAGDRGVFLVAADCHPQTIAVVQTRARPLDITLRVMRPEEMSSAVGEAFGVLLQYPATDGRICDHRALIEAAHEAEALVVVATDLLALTLIEPPGEFGADIAVGSSQRFGVPLGFGGPHAAFLATRETYKRQMPGRVVGVSKDVHGRPAFRLAIQTREQHIRREKATSNICTAQVLLAIMAGMYAVYHGPAGLRAIAERIHQLAIFLRERLGSIGFYVPNNRFFDTITARLDAQSYVIGSAEEFVGVARDKGFNIRELSPVEFSVSLDETTTKEDVIRLVDALRPAAERCGKTAKVHPYAPPESELPRRTSPFLTHPVFNRYHSETEMLRYVKRLEARDLSLAHSMIPLGSCTMKLNATAEMLPVSWPALADIHPFAPADQTRGYAELFQQLEAWLAELTGLPAVSLQPNAGAQGEYAGLLAIRAYHEQRGDTTRRVCLIPTSAHGTNAASAVMAGLRVVTVACDDRGNVDLADLAAKAEQHRGALAALMITYPSTHGVFEEGIRRVCASIHDHGGQVYMDGANMNAQVGLCRPGDIGADVCHLNLHKTFCIPHGGGGPGMGPICVAKHLAPFLPGHPALDRGPKTGVKGQAVGAVSAAPYGSPSILPISWMYIALLGAQGLRRASEVAILNANYMAARLKDHYPVVFTGRNGRVAHEFILDCRSVEHSAGVKVEDVAKRLMDYGFHAPTMSWPVPGTLMIEPTESESKVELDRFCDAMIAIRDEIRSIEEGRADREDNVLKGAPHTAEAVSADDWSHPYSRREAAFPMPHLCEHKFWPPVGRIDNAWGDRHLFCVCPPVEDHEA